MAADDGLMIQGPAGYWRAEPAPGGGFLCRLRGDGYRGNLCCGRSHRSARAATDHARRLSRGEREMFLDRPRCDRCGHFLSCAADADGYGLCDQHGWVKVS